MDFGWMRLRGEHPFKTPVALKGAAQNGRGRDPGTYTARFRMSVRCEPLPAGAGQRGKPRIYAYVGSRASFGSGDDYLLIP